MSLTASGSANDFPRFSVESKNHPSFVIVLSNILHNMLPGSAGLGNMNGGYAEMLIIQHNVPTLRLYQVHPRGS